MEHIALHSASAVGGAQICISCTQIDVTGGGSGTPGRLVAFPGLMIDIYYPVVCLLFDFPVLVELRDVVIV
jgi:hypothetical protein